MSRFTVYGSRLLHFQQHVRQLIRDLKQGAAGLVEAVGASLLGGLLGAGRDALQRLVLRPQSLLEVANKLTDVLLEMQ